MMTIATLAAALFCGTASLSSASLFGASGASASPADSVEVLGHMVPASAIAPVKSGEAPTTNAIDTLPTAVPGVSVLLMNDNTWRYIKSEQYITDRELFSKNWSTSEINPYQHPLDSLPETWSLWLVDSLSSYHAPSTGRISSNFGIRHGRRHQGIDLSISSGTPLYAVFDGKVRLATAKNGYGNLVVIRHDNGLETFYGHMSRYDVKPGDVVHAGDVIGLSGNTGRSTGPHLHFETRCHGLAFDPQRIIDFSNGNLKQRMMVLKRRYFDSSSRYDQNFDEEFLLVEDDARALAEYRKKQEEAARKAMVWYKVKSGDNLGAIARRYHTTVNTLVRLNHLKNANSIRIGQNLRIR